MKSPLVHIEKEGPHITILTLNRPERRNALNLPLMEEICQAVERAGREKNQRVLLIRGAGKAFCAGLDLREAMSSDPTSSQQFAQAVAKTLITVWETPLVTIAVVHGAAVAGGLEEGLIVEQLNIGSDQILDDIEDTFVVKQPPVEDAALAHLHDLQHFLFGTLVVALGGAAIGGQITVTVTVAGLVEEAVILLPQRLYLTVFQQLADDDKAVAPKGVDLLLGQGAVGVFGCWLFHSWSQIRCSDSLG